MPTYDYRCRTCGLEVEVKHGINEQGPATCESCGGVMRKALSSPAILFKGSGWAKKDAQAANKRKPDSGAGAGTKDASPSTNDTLSSGSGEGKPGSGEGKPGSGEGKPGSGEGKPGSGVTVAAGEPATTTSTAD